MIRIFLPLILSLTAPTLSPCADQIADIELFWRLTLLQETVWNAGYYALESPYDYSAAQLGLNLLSTNYPLTKLNKLTDYLKQWSLTRNLDNPKLQEVPTHLRPFLRLVAADLSGAC